MHHLEFGTRDGDLGIGTVVFALLTKILSTGLRFLHMEDVVKLLSGKVVLVTGSSRGIGAAIARLFADQGAKVALHGRDTAALSAVRSEIEKNGGFARDHCDGDQRDLATTMDQSGCTRTHVKPVKPA
jgi:hypothetical protein